MGTSETASGVVQVLDLWVSPYCVRVRVALAAKGVAFSLVPQNVGPNVPKSPLLLQSNPIHQKVPVLLHRGKPVCESLIICEYVDDAFPTTTNKHLLPQDPYLRAMARFWADFADKKVMETLLKFLRVPKQEFGGVINDIKGYLRTLEEGAFPKEGEHPFIGGLEVGFVDVVMSPLVVLIPGMRRVVTDGEEDVDVFEVEKLPRLQAWLVAFGKLPYTHEQDILPELSKAVEYVKQIRKLRFPHE